MILEEQDASGSYLFIPLLSVIYYILFIIIYYSFYCICHLWDLYVGDVPVDKVTR